MHITDSLVISAIRAHYADGSWNPADVTAEVLRRIEAHTDPAIWIYRCSVQQLQQQLKSCNPSQPLYGVPFAVKDNIDVAGMPTTAACPAFSHVAQRTATVVQKLLDAGAILIGKTNLDQFATGLVGVRSPYGAPKNPFNPEFITGGSSSGSAAAVSGGLVSFALGTDTAGSGRVPAAFTNIIGFKPTRGLLSCAAVVPACKSLDCVSIFALTSADAAAVAAVARGFDADDSYSRPPSEIPAADLPIDQLRFGVPADSQVAFFGNSEFQRLYAKAVTDMESLGAKKVTIDLEPFLQAGKLLYDGPWVAERVAGLRHFTDAHQSDLLPVIAKIFASAANFTAADAFAAMHRLAALRQSARTEWSKADVLLLPTAGTIYTQSQVAADPIALNKNLGYYTQFVNLLDLCAVAVPAGFTSAGLPFGVTLIAQAGQDQPLLQLADQFHRKTNLPLGSTHCPMPPAAPIPASTTGILLAVVGAHLSGQPLNRQLTDRGARFVRTTKTSPCYELYRLANTTPSKPGLVRVDVAGSKIELEIWRLSPEAFASFVAEVPPPMVIGTVELEDGSAVKGFLCEPRALKDAHNITNFGGWRAYLKSTQG
jgi:allophanate hydrolase